MHANWNYPTSIRQGAGRLAELADVCAELNVRKPLLVTDSGLQDSIILQAVVDTCDSAAIETQVFSQVKSNPTEQNIVDGVAVYQQGNFDGVIAFGGGSGLDAGKTIALMVGQSGKLWDFEDIGDNWRRVNTAAMAPIIAIPTTAGTGSEVGRAAVIVDESAQSKRIIFHPQMLPQRVILDAALTTGLPANLTAATGMDALSHNLEAYCSPYYHPMATGIALQGIAIIKDNLQQAVQTPDDINVREQMLVASMMGATAFQAGLGAMHALAHPLGAIYDTHHGLLNAILMPYVLQANRNVIEDRINGLAHYLQLAGSGYQSFFNWIIELRQNLNIPNTLSDIGIDKVDLKKIGDMAVQDASAATNPIQFSVQQYADLCARAISGDLS